MLANFLMVYSNVAGETIVKVWPYAELSFNAIELEWTRSFVASLSVGIDYPGPTVGIPGNHKLPIERRVTVDPLGEPGDSLGPSSTSGSSPL